MSFFKKPVSLNDAVEGKVIYILALVFVIQTIYPMTVNESPIFLLIYQFIYALLIVSGILVARESPRFLAILSFLGISWLIAGAIYAFNQEAVWALLLAFLVIASFQAVVIRVLAEFILVTQTVTRDVIYAAIAIYLMIGGIFGVVFGLLETVTFAETGQHAIIDSSASISEIVPWQTTLYYSYATLTTLGYGDILPVTMWARSLASVEAMIGVLYTTIIMARLVGIYVSNREVSD
ncbi:MAG: hypothetical protein Phog2KO_49250 [Phototrophicaceae bacterium]